MTISVAQIENTISSVAKLYPEVPIERIQKGVKQIAQFWQAEDGTAEAFQNFCKAHFIADPQIRQQTFVRLEAAFEQIFGHASELNRELKWHLDVDTGEILPIDYLLGEYSPGAHTIDDLFKSKIAFVILLNFPASTLEERLQNGPNWSREEWAQDRMLKIFSARIPAAVQQKLGQAYLAADNYISEYNILLDKVLTDDNQRFFPADLKLIIHWGLRDEIKAQYANPDGLSRQQMIALIMERIIRQDIPKVVINNPKVLWKPGVNEVISTEDRNINVSNEPEATIRYEKLLDIFHATQLADRYYPNAPTLIQRKFESDREIPEEKVKALFTTLLTSPFIQEVAQIIQKRLGRPLEPFDIWYDGFKSRGTIPPEELDKIVSKKYPSVAAFQENLPQILSDLGFSSTTAAFLAEKIQVDPSRGAGHAMEGGRRSDKAHLRTRIPVSGMQYKGFNIAIHELGHNVEQVFSLNKVDHYFLRGVPNNAFTEAFAFTFQAKDLDLLGIKQTDPTAEFYNVLDQIWSVYEIAGVSLVDIAVWHWLYEHPNASAEELKAAVIKIAIDTWNQYFAPVIGKNDSPLLAIYSHMVAYGLYLPDYAIGHIIDFQIGQYLKNKNMAVEMERMCRLGALTPDEWMKLAVGESISVTPLLETARLAAEKVK
ncbi:hypothetical protein JW964_10620 [candidate division KSB1 bacterium]|nr:hypothetical protein [candidate division KSB1 bacterium]